MANDITGINANRLTQSGSRNAQRINDKADDAGSNDRSSSGADKVSLTSTAARLKELEQRLSDQAPVDTRRVNDMKNAIASGEYQVDADRVADKMIEFESSFDK